MHVNLFTFTTVYVNRKSSYVSIDDLRKPPKTELSSPSDEFRGPGRGSMVFSCQCFITFLVLLNKSLLFFLLIKVCY